MPTPVVLASLWLLLSPTLTCLRRYGSLGEEAAARFLMDTLLKRKEHELQRQAHATCADPQCLERPLFPPLPEPDSNVEPEADNDLAPRM